MNSGNENAIEAWNTVLFDKFVRFRHIVTDGFAEHGARALRECSYPAGARVLDIGCGFGDTTLSIADQGALAVGVDCGDGFIRIAKADAEALGQTRASYFVADVQHDDLRGPYDHAFARFGTMFFNAPVAALRNVRAALRADGDLTMIVWRRREDNAWVYDAEQVVKAFVPSIPDDRTELAHCGPGPFSMAGADVVSDMLKAAGFANISLSRTDCEICLGANTTEAVEFAMALGPAGEIIRLAGPDAERIRPSIVSALRKLFERYQRSDGSIWGGSSSWIVRGDRGL